MTFRRKWIFLCLTFIVPTILNCFLMVAVYVLPFESGEKMSYSLTVLLTYIVLLTLVASHLPPISTETSMLQIYLTAVMCIGTFTTLSTVWTVSLYNQSASRPVPHWLAYTCCRVLKHFNCSTGAWHAGRNRECNGNTTPTDIADDAMGNKFPKLSRVKVDVIYSTPTSPDFSSANDKAHTSNGLHTFPEYQIANGDSQLAWEILHDDVNNEVEGRMEKPTENADVGRDNDLDNITWVEVANIMDAFFLRVVSAPIVIAKLAVLIFFGVTY